MTGAGYIRLTVISLCTVSVLILAFKRVLRPDLEKQNGRDEQCETSGRYQVKPPDGGGHESSIWRISTMRPK